MVIVVTMVTFLGLAVCLVTRNSRPFIYWISGAFLFVSQAVPVVVKCQPTQKDAGASTARSMVWRWKEVIAGRKDKDRVVEL